MYYYHVLARLGSYHGKDFLTYSSTEHLAVGTIVTVTVRNETVLGIVMAAAPKPQFATKPVGAAESPETLPLTSLALLHWLISYYPAPLGIIAQQFIPASLKGQPRAERLEVKNQSIKATALTAEQETVLKQIETSKQSTFLLHGDTGTGKTRIYTELAKKALERGQSALILTPEIGLTPQLVAEFQRSFPPNKVVLLHSGLSVIERRAAWLSILRATEPLIVIGPRSAMFSPLKNIGLIVVDEFHESAYKQEQAPYYQAVRVAAQLARIHKATLLLGSATPAIQDYYAIGAKGLPILRMNQLAAPKSVVKSSVEIIDMRNKHNLTTSAYLSNRLQEAIQSALDQKEQVLIFLNRRGTARLVLCQSCGWQALCPSCDLPLTYHGDNHYLQCHTCGHRSGAPASCPECGSSHIIYKSVGTKSIVEILQKQFPNARIQRFDTDSKKSERLERHYPAVQAGEVDILVGTQLLAKGLDLPKLSLVGVVAADASLYFPDYTAEERTYQLLSQVIGRVGRGHRQGTAIIQSYTPDNPTLRAVVNKDWSGFYRQQLDQRRSFLFPPFCFVLKLNAARATSKAARTAAEKLAAELRQQNLRVQITGPAPSFWEKAAGKYRWQLIVKSKSRPELLKILPLLPSGWTYDLDPTDLL
jgi:primosomal protein N' (replication factor Y) (superfamily II helicase)